MSGFAERVDAIEEEARRHLASLGAPADLVDVAVELDGCDRPDGGSRPACIVRDARGRRYFLKAATKEHVAAELFAGEVRRLGRRPSIATAARREDVPGFGLVDGMLQPMLEHPGERLPTEPRAWTRVQIEVMLREHPWEWLLANLDTHVDQYVLLGPHRIPFDIDWDHSLLDLHVRELTRVTSRNPAIPPLRNALYDAYVRGEIDLDLRGMLRQARRVTLLDDRALVRALRAWSERCGHPEERRRAVTAAFLRRKDGVGDTFREFVRSLRAERAARRDPSRPKPPLGDRARNVAVGAWQRFVIDVLHDVAVVPYLKAQRAVIARRDAWLARRSGG
jgi:hypothetical protein